MAKLDEPEEFAAEEDAAYCIGCEIAIFSRETKVANSVFIGRCLHRHNRAEITGCEGGGRCMKTLTDQDQDSLGRLLRGLQEAVVNLAHRKRSDQERWAYAESLKEHLQYLEEEIAGEVWGPTKRDQELRKARGGE